MPRLWPVVNWLTPDGIGSEVLDCDASQETIDAAVLEAAAAGGRSIAVRFCDSYGHCRHIVRYADADA